MSAIKVDQVKAIVCPSCDHRIVVDDADEEDVFSCGYCSDGTVLRDRDDLEDHLATEHTHDVLRDILGDYLDLEGLTG